MFFGDDLFAEAQRFLFFFFFASQKNVNFVPFFEARLVCNETRNFLTAAFHWGGEHLCTPYRRQLDLFRLKHLGRDSVADRWCRKPPRLVTGRHSVDIDGFRGQPPREAEYLGLKKLIGWEVKLKEVQFFSGLVWPGLKTYADKHSKLYQDTAAVFLRPTNFDICYEALIKRINQECSHFIFHSVARSHFETYSTCVFSHTSDQMFPFVLLLSLWNIIFYFI